MEYRNGVAGFLYAGRWYPIIAGGDGTDDDAGATGDDGADVGDDSSTDDDDSDSGDGAGAKPKPGEVRLTTKQLKDRLERAQRADRMKMAKAAGFDTVESFNEAMKSAKEIADRDKTESQKALERATTLTAENERLKRDNAALRLETAVGRHASGLGFVDPSDAVRLADFSEVVDDEGVVDEKEIKRILKELATSKPYLVGKSSGSDTTDADKAKAGANGGAGRLITNRAASNPGRNGAAAGNGLTADKAAEYARRFPGIASAPAIKKAQSST